MEYLQDSDFLSEEYETSSSFDSSEEIESGELESIRFLVKLFKGIARSDDPMDIVIAILEDLEGVFTKDKKNKKKKNKNRRKKKNKKENNENENNENKEEEPEPEENAESEKPENESQDLN
ncbi:hypothetical protein ACROYT_G004201 [Oculina patagonica]